MKALKSINKYRDLIAAVVMTVFSGFMFKATYDIQDTSIYAVGPRVVPQIITLAMIGLSLVCLYGAIAGLVRKKAVEESKEANWKAALTTLALLLAYVFLFSRIGFILDSILYLFLQFCILEDGKRRYLRYLLISVISVAIIYAFFRYVLLLMLPSLWL